MNKSFLITAGIVLSVAAMIILEAMGYPVFMILAVVIILGILLAGVFFIPPIRIPLIIVCVIVVVGSSAVVFGDEWKTPLSFEYTQETNLYPPPNPDTNPEAFAQWNRDKTVIDPGEGAQKALAGGWLASAAALWIFSFLAWVFSIIPIPSLKGIQIPIQLIFLVVWIGFSINVVSSPVNQPGMDTQTAEALSLQWTIGFAENIWWPIVITAIGWVISTIRSGGARSGIFIVGIVTTGFTWLAMQLFQVTIDPTVVAWTLCTQQVFDTSISMATCQEAFASGRIAALAVSMAWGWVVSLLTD